MYVHVHVHVCMYVCTVYVGGGLKTVHVHVHVSSPRKFTSQRIKFISNFNDQINPSFKLSEATNTYTKVLPPPSYTNINYCIYM